MSTKVAKDRKMPSKHLARNDLEIGEKFWKGQKAPSRSFQNLTSEIDFLLHSESH